MSIELRIRDLSPKNRKAAIEQSALAYVGEPNSLQEFVESGVITEANAADLLTFHRLLDDAWETKSLGESGVADRIELQRASIKHCPPDQLQPALKKLEALRAQANEINSASHFLATQNYYLPQFFENYVPKVVLLRRKQTV